PDASEFGFIEGSAQRGLEAFPSEGESYDLQAVRGEVLERRRRVVVIRPVVRSRILVRERARRFVGDGAELAAVVVHSPDERGRLDVRLEDRRLEVVAVDAL